jgi:hypothetical protein
MAAVRKQQMVHHLTGTGSMQYMLNMMKRLYQTMESPYRGRPLGEAPSQKKAQPRGEIFQFGIGTGKSS